MAIGIELVVVGVVLGPEGRICVARKLYQINKIFKFTG